MNCSSKVTNRILALFVIAVLAFGSLFYMSRAFGANTKDTEFHFDLNLLAKSAGTDYREKTNASSVYLNIYSNNIQRCTLHVDGKKSLNSTSYTDRTIGTAPLEGKRTGKCRIKTYVYERGDRYCRLTAYKSNDGGKVTGVWSPDCSNGCPHPSLN